MSTPSMLTACCWTPRLSAATCPPCAATDTTALASPDLVLVCVKSADTEQAGRSLTGHLRPETSVLSLQNGVDNAPRLRAVTGHAVIPVVVYVGSEMAGPGHVRHHGGGDLAIGASAASDALAQTLEAAGVRTTIADDIDKTLWSKLIINCAFNALSAVAAISYGPDAGSRRHAGRRYARVCRRLRRSLAPLAFRYQMISSRHILNIPTIMPNQMSSTAQDLARGKPSEIDFLNGYVVRKGAELGIATPTNHARR